MVQAKVQEMHKELVDAGLGYSGYRQGQAKEIRKYDPLRLKVTSLKLNNCPTHRFATDVAGMYLLIDLLRPQLLRYF